MSPKYHPGEIPRQARSTNDDGTSLGLIRALNVLFPDTGPGGYFGDGSIEAKLDDVSRANALGFKIARTQTRAWLEAELGSEFGLSRKGLNPSVQIEFKPNRPLPNASLKWNIVTSGTTEPLKIEDATIKYLRKGLPNWGNNRTVNNDYVAGSTISRGFETPFKSVYFDHLSGDKKLPTANEAFTGPTPGRGDMEAWIFLANNRVVSPGMIVNFQNESGQAISPKSTAILLSVGYQVSVVPYTWWSSCLSPDDSERAA